MTPPSWIALRRASTVFHLELRETWSGTTLLKVELVSRVGVFTGVVLATLMVAELTPYDADRMLRALVVTSLLQLGPGAPVSLGELAAVADHLGLDAIEPQPGWVQR